MKYIYAAAMAVAFGALGQAADDIPKCGDGSQCPEDSPCCSQYGQCGVGAYCLGGCDPRHSFDLKSCLPAPVCKSQDFSMDSLDSPKVRSQSRYLGNGSETNWVTSGQPREYSDSVLLTMAPSTVGTLLMSAHYVWYGNIKATMKTSGGAGVVTAFILMSDMKDEIDFEFVGSKLNTAETNFYFQGITNYENGKNIELDSDTRQQWHDYEIDWKPDETKWLIDGKTVRTLKRDDTYNETTKQHNYPQTPSRVQLSLWPGGLPSNGKGTIEWAGGLVDWDDSEYMPNGYYYAEVKDISVTCYDPPNKQNSNGNSYYYSSVDGTEDTVVIGNNGTTIGSMQATGDDPEKGAPSPSSSSGSKSSSSSSSSKSSSTATKAPESVPGMSGGGNAGNSGGSSSGNSDSGSSDSGTNSNGDTSGSAFDTPGSDEGPSSFEQNTGGNGGGSGGSDTSQANHVVAGSAVALLGFFIAALML
ncbi:hypothetical protein Q7P37_004370 [Cladosporium fusiforme]